MEFATLRAYCLAKPGATDGFPFGDDVLVVKVGPKIFAIIAFKTDLKISLKCDPELAEGLRASYNAVTPGYHLNKKHWNTVALNRDAADAEVLKMIDHSYNIVLKTLKKADRIRIGGA